MRVIHILVLAVSGVWHMAGSASRECFVTALVRYSPRMISARQLLVAALAAATLVITAAPTPPPVLDPSTYTWQKMFGAETLPLSNGTVAVIKVVGDDIYVGGDFTNFAGIATADRIARWVGARQVWEGLAAFSALEGGSALDGSITAGSVNAIEVSGSTIFVGGNFTVTTANSETHHNLAWFTIPDQTFNGYWHYDWHGFPGNGVHNDAVWNGQVNTILAYNNALYVGGTFTDGYDGENNDYMMLGLFNLCFTGVVSACVNTLPDVTVCGGVTITCDVNPPNYWVPAGINALSGGPVLNSFVSSIAVDQDYGVLVTGNFVNAGTGTAPHYLARFTNDPGNDWIAQGISTGTMYPTAALNGQLYAAGWEGAYRRTGADAWEEICGSSLVITNTYWKTIAPISSALVILASSGGISGCNPTTGAAVQLSTNPGVVASALYKGDLIVVGEIAVGALVGTSDSIARYVLELPTTNRDTRGCVDAAVLLAALAALTALAGVQMRRSA